MDGEIGASFITSTKRKLSSWGGYRSGIAKDALGFGLLNDDNHLSILKTKEGEIVGISASSRKTKRLVVYRENL